MTDKQMTEYLEKIDRVIENGKYKADWGSLAEYPVPWTKKNAEAIWGTQPYKVFGEGKKQKAGSSEAVKKFCFHRIKMHLLFVWVKRLKIRCRFVLKLRLIKFLYLKNMLINLNLIDIVSEKCV